METRALIYLLVVRIFEVSVGVSCIYLHLMTSMTLWAHVVA